MFPPNYQKRRTGLLYGAFAFASVVLTGFASLLAHQPYYTSAHWVPVVFAMGGIYASLGVLWGSSGFCGSRLPWLYYATQGSLLTAILLLSPSRGYLAVIVLPLLSQAIFDLRTPQAAAFGLYLFGISVGLWFVPYGWSGVGQAVMNYSTAFIFTVAFSLITKQALIAREREAELRQEVEDANRQLREYAAQAEELATTRERNRVAREIHDGVGHYLTVVKTQLDAAAALFPSNPERARETIVKASRLAAEALDDVRRSVGALRTDVVRPALPDALRSLTHESELPVALRIAGDARPLPPAVEHALFRSIQEGLTNVRKHAGASAAEVTLEFRPAGWVAVAITDDGRGSGTAEPSGYGLRGIRERIELLGGRVRSGNRDGGGFALNVEVPA